MPFLHLSLNDIVGAWPAPTHYPNQCWRIDNWILMNKIQWNLNQNTKIYIEENAFEILGLDDLRQWCSCWFLSEYSVH